jgi:hypothetical protein
MGSPKDSRREQNAEGLGNSDLRISEVGQEIIHLERLRLLGPTMWEDGHLFRIFFEVGKAYAEGAKSMRQVADSFDNRIRRKKLPVGIPASKSRLSTLCSKTCVVVGRQLELGRAAGLFIHRGCGREISDLSPLGWDVWRRIRLVLLTHQLISETD